MIVKNLNFGGTAREQVFKGIEKLTNAVSSTLGASGKCVILEDAQGNPIITKDGVTVADSIVLLNPIEATWYRACASFNSHVIAPIASFKLLYTMISSSREKSFSRSGT